MAHAVAARACLNYLSSLEERRKLPPAKWLAHSHGDIIYGFRDYASRYWPAHYEEAIRSSELDEDQKEELGEDRKRKLVEDRKRELEEALVSFFKNGMESWSHFYSTQQTKANQLPSKEPLVAAVSVGCSDLVKLILARSSPQSKVLAEAFEVAVQIGNEALIGLLLDAGADSNPAFHVVASYGQNHVVTMLLKRGLSLLDAHRGVLAPLHLACMSGHLAMVEMLLDYGLDYQARVGDYAEESKSLVPDSTPLHIASQYGHVKVMEKLLLSGADPATVDENGSTPLHRACEWQQPEAVNTLLEKLVKVDASNKERMTPLHLASGSGRVEIVDALRQAYSRSQGVDPDSIQVLPLFRMRDNNGRTPFHWAAGNGHDKVVEKLLSFEQHIEAREIAGIPDNDLCVPLHLAAQNGHSKVLDLLLKHDEGSEISRSNNTGLTPVHMGVLRGHMNVVSLLCLEHVRQDITLSLWDDRSWCPLHYACDKGHTEIVRILLESGADPNITDLDDNTPLHLAVKHESVDTAKLLLKHRADLISRNYEGVTPIHVAAGTGNLKMVRELLQESKALPNADELLHLRDNKGRPPIICAAQSGHLGAIELLLTEGANLDEVDNKKRTLLHHAAVEGHLMVVNHLLKFRKEDVNAKDSSGNQPLHLASNEGHLDVVKALLEEHADPEDKNDDNKTPFELATKGEVVEELVKSFKDPSVEEQSKMLHLAAKMGYDSVVHLLFGCGVGPDIKDDLGRTPLSHAASDGRSNIVKVLIENERVDPNSKDEAGRTPLSYAAEHGAIEIVQSLLGKLSSPGQIDEKDSSDRTPLWHAAVAGNSSIIDLLLGYGADPNIADADGCTALHMTASNGHIDSVKSLLSSGKVLDGNKRDVGGATPMYLAAFWGRTETVSYLLEKGLSVNIPGPQRWFPLHAAFDNVEILRKLLDAPGAKVDVKNEDGDTTLFLSVQQGYEEQVALLLSYKANPLAPNKKRSTPLHIAAGSADSEIFAHLLEHVSIGADTPDESGQTPLLIAASQGNSAALEKLVERKDVNLRQVDKDKRSLLWFAVKYNNALLIKALRDLLDFASFPENYEELLDLAIKERSDKALGELWPEIPSAISHDPRVIERAVAEENTTIIRLIFESGANVDWRDEHGWSLADTHRAFEPKLQRNRDADQTGQEEDHKDKNTTLDTEDTFHRPAVLNEMDKSELLELDKDGLTLSFCGEDVENDYHSASIRANHPIPPNRKFYFEVEVLNEGERKIIAVGVGNKQATLAKRPGMDPYGWGYHAEDGGTFHYPRGTKSYINGVYGTGAVIGCCIDPVERTAFFTRDRKRLEEQFDDLSGRLFPMVGMGCKDAEVRVKFDCSFDEAQLEKDSESDSERE